MDGDRTRVGSIGLHLAGPGAGRGIVSWALRDTGATALDGLPTTLTAAPAPTGPPPAHPNGALVIDHLVAASPDFDRTLGVLQSAGLDLRRVTDGLGPGRPGRFAFLRVGETVLELVEAGADSAAVPAAPARFWGLTLAVADLDAAVASLGDALGTARAAVQPGRRIATVRREAGLSVALALISPR